MARVKAQGSRRTKHKTCRIGLQKKGAGLVFKVTKNNTFRVFGDSIGTATLGAPAHPKKVFLKSTHHTWNNNNPVPFDDTNDPNFIDITGKPIVSYAKRKGRDTSDDLTVTIIVDEGNPGEDQTECVFTDVDFDH